MIRATTFPEPEKTLAQNRRKNNFAVETVAHALVRAASRLRLVSTFWRLAICSGGAGFSAGDSRRVVTRIGNLDSRMEH